MKTSREVIWGLIYDMLPEGIDDEIVMYQGIEKWETEVKDIVDSVEELAEKLEDHMFLRAKNPYKKREEK